MAIKVELVQPKDLEGIKKSLIEFLVDSTLNSHTPQEIEALLNYWKNEKRKVEIK